MELFEVAREEGATEVAWEEDQRGDLLLEGELRSRTSLEVMDLLYGYVSGAELTFWWRIAL